jgi:hypothetical protein
MNLKNIFTTVLRRIPAIRSPGSGHTALWADADGRVTATDGSTNTSTRLAVVGRIENVGVTNADPTNDRATEVYFITTGAPTSGTFRWEYDGVQSTLLDLVTSTAEDIRDALLSVMPVGTIAIENGLSYTEFGGEYEFTGLKVLEPYPSAIEAPVIADVNLSGGTDPAIDDSGIVVGERGSHPTSPVGTLLWSPTTTDIFINIGRDADGNVRTYWLEFDVTTANDA